MIYFGDLLELPTIAVRSVSTRDGWTWAAHDVIEGPTRKQFTGKKPRELTIACFFHVEFISPRPTASKLQAIADSAEAFELWTSAGAYWGTFVLEGVDAQPVWTFPDGRIIAMTCNLTLSDPGLEGGDAITQPAALVRHAVATTDEPIPETVGDPSAVPPAEIARR